MGGREEERAATALFGDMEKRSVCWCLGLVSIFWSGFYWFYVCGLPVVFFKFPYKILMESQNGETYALLVRYTQESE